MSARLVKIIREQAETVKPDKREVCVYTKTRSFTGVITKADFTNNVLGIRVVAPDGDWHTLIAMEAIEAIQPRWEDAA
ncbi:hypothetical protein SAMN05216358_0075 [Rhizobium sp. AN5]|uniref:hypothetical protein n=1 Tax=Rhizobium sp. AN5 TaxID=1855304 RepID=UPI000BC42A31|nr:hypothetical protein [Rhizobium sp. AN5]SOC90056.1 hypothetical protein SAMN05216358_0075 [Rhizobium sp. AN5]